MAHQAGKKLYFVWNFLEKGKHEYPYGPLVEGWRGTSRFVIANYEDFVCTQLQRNLNPNGLYPFVNFAAFDGLNFDGFKDGPPPEKWMGRMKAMNDALPTPQVASPGGYTEIGTNTGKPLAPWLAKDDKSLFIVTSFKATDENDTQLQESFEKNWQEASGSNFILQNAPKELGIKHCGLYKKFTKRPGLLYVLRAELGGVGEQSEAAKAFLTQLKAFSFPKYFECVDADLFYSDSENVFFADSGKKKLPEGFSYKP